MRDTLLDGLFFAVAERKAWDVDATWTYRAEPGPWTKLALGFRPLPELLEETDEALSQKANLLTLQNILKRLNDVKSNTAGLYPEVSEPTTLDAASMQSLDPTAEEHVVMCDSTAFPRLFAPMTKSGSADAFKVVMPSCLMLVLECTVLRIWYFRPETTADVQVAVREETERQAHQLACTLCKVLLSFTQDEKLADACAVRFCLTIARNVFEQQDRRAETGWCHACLIANQLRTLRIRNNGSPTLCKVEDITAGIAEAAKYKSQFNPSAFAVRGRETSSTGLLRFSPQQADESAKQE